MQNEKRNASKLILSLILNELILCLLLIHLVGTMEIYAKFSLLLQGFVYADGTMVDFGL